MNLKKHSRRTFIKSTAAAAGALAVGGLVPSSVLGANDRVNIGLIGVGGMGTSHLNSLLTNIDDFNIGIGAVCDVYKRRITKASESTGGKGYMDYRLLLEDKDIDAVIIATPDHWHSKMAIDAMDAGKHVYLEKPMTLTVEQAIEVRNAVKRYGKKLQVGPQNTSMDQYWNAQKEIRDGGVGKVTYAQASYNRNVKGGAFNTWFLIDETAGPHMDGEDKIDWDMWLGHEWGLAPRIPWNAEHFFRFRKYFQYNGGVATDLLYHSLAPLLLSIVGENGEFPRRVTAGGGLYTLKDGRDIPDVFNMILDYSSEFTIMLASILTNNTQLPTRIYGQHATIEFDKEAKLTANGGYKQEFMDSHGGVEQVILPSKNVGGQTSDMERNFINAIRQDEKLFCNAELGAATMVGIKMGVEAYRQNKTMMWDAQNERVVNG
ncbi:Gfo/Idh/MocA family oxidoreductase [Candidatus Latescibacterota bacterium]